MDKLGRLEVEQLKVTSTTPPADSGLYKIDETTMGVVGDLKFRHPKTGAMSSALTVFKFENFRPSLLGSLVAGATYEQSGNAVTVTATAHGLPNTKNGYSFFWPGSAAIPAGWYSGFLYLNANAFSFQNPTPQTVPAGAAITGTLPYVSPAVVCTLILPADAIGPNGSISAQLVRSGDATTNLKSTILVFGGVSLFTVNVAAASSMTVGSMTSMALGMDTLSSVVLGGNDNTASSSTSLVPAAVSLSINQAVELRLRVGVASQWAAIDAAVLEVIK